MTRSAHLRPGRVIRHFRLLLLTHFLADMMAADGGAYIAQCDQGHIFDGLALDFQGGMAFKRALMGLPRKVSTYAQKREAGHY